eukprot:GGOE01004492.1.p2 GENE.GGOE01004492.1~~GGOE01004492.1.p2  ORF type:complete len:185 (+),score=22.10 GGOE01004492.1:70-624(+)
MSHTGVVRRWVPEKGFGFIQRDDGEDDIFVHAYALNCKGFRSLTAGQAVSFDVNDSQGKPRAVNVSGPGGEPLLGGDDAVLLAVPARENPDGCYRCGRSGHYSRDCPETARGRRDGDSRPHRRSQDDYDSSRGPRRDYRDDRDRDREPYRSNPRGNDSFRDHRRDDRRDGQRDERRRGDRYAPY